MAKEKSKLSPAEQQKKQQDRVRVNVLRGVLAVSAAAVAMELGKGKVMTQPDFDRKVEPVTQNAPQPAPDNMPTAEWPGLGMTPQSVPEKPAPAVDNRPVGNVPPSTPDIAPQPETPQPMVYAGEAPRGLNLDVPDLEAKPLDVEHSFDEPLNYEDLKELSEGEHYSCCESFLLLCHSYGMDESGNLSELTYNDKMELAREAIGVEISRGLDQMLPAMNGLLGTISGIEEALAEYDANRGCEPVARAKLQQHMNKVNKVAQGAYYDMWLAHDSFNQTRKECDYFYKIAQKHEKTGKPVAESRLEFQIKRSYNYAKYFVNGEDRAEEREAAKQAKEQTQKQAQKTDKEKGVNPALNSFMKMKATEYN